MSNFSEVTRFGLSPPNLPIAPKGYDPLYQEQLNNVLRLFFNSLTNWVNSEQLLDVGNTGTTTGASGSFSGVFHGISGSTPTYTIYWTQVGNLVYLDMASVGGVSGTGTGTSFYMTGVPASLYPTRSQGYGAIIYTAFDGGSGSGSATMSMDTSGVLNFYTLTTGGVTGGWVDGTARSLRSIPYYVYSIA